LISYRQSKTLAVNVHRCIFPRILQSRLPHDKPTDPVRS
jgi:hypothetical protein